MKQIGRPDAVPYNLRHSTNMVLRKLGITPEARAAICGHSTTTNLRDYDHISEGDARDAANKVDAFFRNGGNFRGNDQAPIASKFQKSL